MNPTTSKTPIAPTAEGDHEEKVADHLDEGAIEAEGERAVSDGNGLDADADRDSDLDHDLEDDFEDDDSDRGRPGLPRPPRPLSPPASASSVSPAPGPAGSSPSARPCWDR